MPAITRKEQVTIPKPFRERLQIKEGDNITFEVKDNILILRKKETRSILGLGGIAKGREVGVGNEREYAKKIISKRIAKEGLKSG